MPLPRRDLIAQWSFTALVFFLASASKLWAIGKNQPIHFSGDKQYWDRKTNRVELFGHATVTQPGETLSADHIVLDQNTRVLDANGNCVYISGESIIFGEEMHFNLDTRTGSVIRGKVTTDSFMVSGERINKLGEGRFQTHRSEYTTCLDCPASWSFLAGDVDLTFGGYAYMSDVTAKVVDTPALWFPFLVIPLKTKRQTGFLFPAFAYSDQNGLMFTLPFFWATGQTTDMTIAAGAYTKKGERVTWEGRYALADRSNGTADAYYQRDNTFYGADNNLYPNRWAVDVSERQLLPLGIDEKLRLTEVSDNIYPNYFGDVPGGGLPELPSSLSFSYGSSDVSAYVAGERFRNLLNTNVNPTDFDISTVQALPKSIVTSNDRLLLGNNVAAGLTLGVDNFTRSAPPFDTGVSPVDGTTPIPVIRKATRVSITPSLYTTLRPFDVISLVPSLQYRGFFYNFSDALPDLSRGYLLFQADLSAQLERIYETGDPDVPRMKHLIRPLLTYSYIPYYLDDPTHTFVQQIQAPGYNFDDSDIIPFTATPSQAQYFYPLGNSLAYGIATQLIERVGKNEDPSPGYVNAVDFTAGQAFSFKEYELAAQNPSYQPQPLTRFFATLAWNLGNPRLGYSKFSSATTYYYYPYIPGLRHVLSTSASYVFERATHRRVFSFERSVGLSYTLNKLPGYNTSNLVGGLKYSLSDYIMPSASISYDFTAADNGTNGVWNGLLGAGVDVNFQSPSRCWSLDLGESFSPTAGWSFNFNFNLNLTGSGMQGLGAAAAQVSGT